MSIESWIRLANYYRYTGDHFLADRIMFYIELSNEIGTTIDPDQLQGEE